VVEYDNGMDDSSFHIRFLVLSLYFIRHLIVHSQAHLQSTAAPSAFDTSTSLTFWLLVQETQRLARDPYLADRFRDGLDRGEGDIFRHFDLERFADRVGFERLVLASSIVTAPTRKAKALKSRLCGVHDQSRIRERGPSPMSTCVF